MTRVQLRPIGGRCERPKNSIMINNTMAAPTSSNRPSVSGITANIRALPRKPTVAIVLTLIATALILAAMGRLWIASSGRVLIYAFDTWSSDNSQHLADAYTFAHAIKGVAFFWMLAALFKKLTVGWRLWIATVIEAAWELVENSPPVIERFRAVTVSLGYTGDTIINATGDILAMMIGFAVAKAIGFKKSALLFVAVELLLAFTIRDNLTLTVLMLSFPIDAVRVWQAAGH
jgi:hypothetical protein